jgi:hypothetical protein
MRFEYSLDVSPPGLILPISVSAIGTRNGKKVEAKIDTGTDISVIPEKLRKELRLLPRGVIKARGAFDKKSIQYPTFFVILSINHSFSFELEVVSSNRKYFLMGRDLLNQIVLNANGPTEIFELTNETTSSHGE